MNNTNSRPWARRCWLVLAVTVGGLAGCATSVDRPDSPNRQHEASAGWHAVPVPGKKLTTYQVVRHPGGQMAWRAEANSSASMWRYPLAVPPELNRPIRFSWYVDALLPGADLATTGLTDSPVRVVLGFGGDLGRLSAKQRMLFELAAAISGEMPPYATLVYSWDNALPVDTVVPHPRLDRIRKLVLESGPANLGQWMSYERDVAVDYQRLFGEPPGPLLWVALMTDSDNVQGRATAWYGEISLGNGRLLPLQ